MAGGLKGYNGAVYIAAQTSLTLTNEACTDSGDDTTFYVTNAAKRYLDDTAAFTVEVDDGGGWDPAPSYTLQHAGGVIVFDSPLGAGDIVRISGAYLPVAQVARATEWSLDIEKSIEQDTEFGSSWESNVMLLGKASGSFKGNWQNGTWFTQLKSTTPRMVVVLYTDTTQNMRYEFMALLNKDSVAAAVAGLVEEEVAFQSVGQVHYRTFA